MSHRRSAVPQFIGQATSVSAIFSIRQQLRPATLQPTTLKNKYSYFVGPPRPLSLIHSAQNLHPLSSSGTSPFTMTSHILSPTAPLPASVLNEIANGGALDEISNSGGAVRRYIFNHGLREKTTGKLRKALIFFVYQTGRYGPQNGFRLVFVHQGFCIASATKNAEDAEDEIDRVDMDIPQGHMEVVVLGDAPPRIEDPAQDSTEGPVEHGD